MPSSITPIPDENITEGNNLNLTCQASGTPSPAVSWIIVSSGQRTNGSVLQLTNISRNEAGDYRCEASNECGDSSEPVTVTVQCKCMMYKCTLLLNVSKLVHQPFWLI